MLFYSGLPFYRDAWTALRHRSANMNTLIALGTGAAFLYSVWVIASGGTGRLFRSRRCDHRSGSAGPDAGSARARAGLPMRSARLMNLQPATARVIREGAEQEIPLAEVRVGRRCASCGRANASPVDGMVREGASEIDESMLTGESLPVAEAPGREVFGGTMNATGAFRFEATKVGRATALAQIIELVKQAQGSKAPVARMADVVSGYFTDGGACDCAA